MVDKLSITQQNKYKYKENKHMNKNKTDNKIIFNQKLAGYLMMQGFILKKMERNEKYPQKNVFIFRQSDNLETEISKYLNK